MIRQQLLENHRKNVQIYTNLKRNVFAVIRYELEENMWLYGDDMHLALYYALSENGINCYPVK